MIKRSVSFWLLVAAVGLFLLQWIPFTGIFLMFLGAGFVNAWLVYLVLAALFVEGVIGRLPRVVAIVPIVVVGAYYWAYQEQHRLLAEEIPKLKSINIGKVLDFEPSTESLVFDNTSGNQVEYFVARYRIPVAYSGNLSARMAPASECSAMPSFHNGAFAWVQSVEKDYPYKMLTQETAPCMLTRREPPAKPPVHVQQVDYASPTLKRFGISEPSTDVVVDGKVVGSLRKIVVHRISPYLWFVGCALIDNPSAWMCTTSFFDEREEVILSDPPNGAEMQQLHERVSILLGIQKYTNDDILHFTGYPENAAIIALAKSPEHTLPSRPTPAPKDAVEPGAPGFEITGAKLLVCHDHKCVEQPLASPK
jgi:hypothetical protein